jgi:hypothetical protein
VSASVVAVAAAPDWATEMTAIGTVAVAVVAVGVALFAEWRAGKRLREEHQRSDKVLAEERALADRRLAGQRAHSDAQLAEERAAADRRLAEEIRAADKRLAEERQAELDREQWAEAYLVQVTPARVGVVTTPGQISSEVERPLVIVVNHGRYVLVGDGQPPLAVPHRPPPGWASQSLHTSAASRFASAATSRALSMVRSCSRVSTAAGFVTEVAKPASGGVRGGRRDRDHPAGLNGHADRAAELFAEDLAAGQIPGVRRVRKEMKVG